MSDIGIINYAGPAPAARRSILATLWYLITRLILLVILCIYMVVRAALLLAGFACVSAGTILLALGGKRSAGQKLRQWRDHFDDLLRLWIGDILRPLRRLRNARARRPLSVIALP